MTELRKYINRKEIPENEDTEKIAHIVKNILNYNKQQRRKGRPSDLAHKAQVACVAKVSYRSQHINF